MNAPDTKRRRQVALLLGIGMLAASTLVIGLSLAVATGRFQDKVTVEAKVTSVGSQLRPGARVKFRGVTVGRLAEITEPGVNGRQSVVELALMEERLDTIPRNVTARVIPSSLFGESQLELVPPRRLSPDALTGSTVVRADTSAETVEVQASFETMDRLVTALQPAKASAALAVIARGLEGQGERLGTNIERVDDLLGTLRANDPLFRRDLQALVRFTQGLATAAPDLRAAMRDMVGTFTVLAEKRGAVAELIRRSSGLVDRVLPLLTTNADSIVCLVRSAASTVGELGAEAHNIPRGLESGLLVSARFIAILSNGPWTSMDVVVDQLLKDPLAPPLYTQRPSYPGGPGAQCNGLTTGSRP